MTTRAASEQDFNAMSTPELIVAYNNMVLSEVGQALGNRREVTRFQDRPTGVARCEALASSIRAWVEGQRAEERRTEAPPRARRQRVTTPDHAATDLTGMVTQGSNRERALAKFSANVGQYLTQEELVKAVYNAANWQDFRSRLAMVLIGVRRVLEVHDLPYELLKQTVNKELTIGLFPKTPGRETVRPRARAPGAAAE